MEAYTESSVHHKYIDFSGTGCFSTSNCEEYSKFKSPTSKSALYHCLISVAQDEFVFCYEVVTDYNDDMSLYDNFKYVP